MSQLKKQKNWNYEYRLQLKIDYLRIIKEIYWSMDYKKLVKIRERYKFLVSKLKNYNIDPTLVIIQFVPSKILVELIQHDILEDSKNIPNYELTYSKLNEIALLR